MAVQHKDLAEETNKGDFDTPILNEQQVNEGSCVDATEDDEGLIHGEYDVILDIDALYHDFLDPSIYTLSVEDVAQETNLMKKSWGKNL